MKNRHSQVAFSRILRKKGSELMNAKVNKVNELLTEELELRGIDYIKNDNILFSNNANDGLHVNVLILVIWI